MTRNSRSRVTSPPTGRNPRSPDPASRKRLQASHRGNASALNHACRRVLKWCSCPAGSYRAEDFRTTDNPADIQLGCVRGMCRTSLP
jgi:hypothetical protein